MNKKILIFLLIIILLGIFLRFYRIDFLSLWHDEVAYLQTAQGFFDFIPNYIFYKDGVYNNLSSSIFNPYTPNKGFGSTPPFYNFVMNIWIDIFGNSEIALRAFSAICGILSIIFIFLIAKYLFNSKIALLTAFLFTINPYNIAYSQEATLYTLVVLLGLLSNYYFIKSIKKNKIRYWIPYSIFSVLGIYTHTFFMFIILFEILYFILFIKSYKKKIKNFILSLFLIFILYLPWLPHFYYANLYANKYFWLNVFNWIDVPLTLIVFGIGQTLIVKESQIHNIVIVTFFYLIGFITPFLLGIFRNLKIKKNKKIIFLLLYLFVPIIIPAILSIISRPIFQWQYIMVACPAFYILIAKGLANVRKKLYFIFMIIIIILSFLSLIHYYSTPIFKGDWREAANYLKKNEIQGDLIIVHSPQIIDTLKYYYKGNLPIKGFPDVPLEKLNEENVKVTEENIANIDSVIKDYKRIWLIQRLVKDKEETIPNYLDKKYKRLYFNKFVWVRVYLYQK